MPGQHSQTLERFHKLGILTSSKKKLPHFLGNSLVFSAITYYSGKTLPYDPGPIRKLSTTLEQVERIVYIPDSDNVIHFRPHGPPIHVDVWNTETGEKDHKKVAQ